MKYALCSGGDPMVLRTEQLEKYMRPLLALPQLQSIRIGSKSLAYWPYRYLGPEGDKTLKLFTEMISHGKHVTLMAHFTHPRELDTPVVKKAIARLQSCGVVIRCQAPLIRHINDDGDIWREMWVKQVNLGLVPYYMFVERDTGPRGYFEVPLYRALEIYQHAIRRVSGLARTVRSSGLDPAHNQIHHTPPSPLRIPRRPV